MRSRRACCARASPRARRASGRGAPKAASRARSPRKANGASCWSRWRTRSRRRTSARRWISPKRMATATRRWKWRRRCRAGRGTSWSRDREARHRCASSPPGHGRSRSAFRRIASSGRPRFAPKGSRPSIRTATAGCSSNACCPGRESCVMSEIAALIGQASAGKAHAVVLIEGDEYLARTSARELAEAIVPSRERALNLIVLDAAAGAREIASHLVTVGMFAAPKAIVVEGADAFAEEVDAERELTRVRELWQARRQRDAARRLLKLVRPAGWGAADVAPGSKAGASAAKWRKDVGAAPDESDKGWLQELSSWALAQNVVAPPDDLDVLVQAVERGLPPKTHLILVAESLPPKHPLVRLAEDKGAHVRRRAERRGRTIDTLDISPVVADELGPLKERLARDAALEPKNRPGDDPRPIPSELRQLPLYTGDPAQITPG